MDGEQLAALTACRQGLVLEERLSAEGGEPASREPGAEPAGGGPAGAGPAGAGPAGAEPAGGGPAGGGPAGGGPAGELSREVVGAGMDGGPAVYRFGQREGPLASYERVLCVLALDDGQHEVAQWTRARVGLPWWSWLVAGPVRMHLRRLSPAAEGEGQMPWWGPPVRLDRRSASLVAVLAALSAVEGYVSGLLPVTLTFAARQFHKTTLDQGLAFALVQLCALPALVALVLADTRGRRSVVLRCCAAAVVACELSALAPSFALLVLGQVCAGVSLGAATIATVVVAVEEVPAGARAWSVGILAMAVGLGAGIPLSLMPLAGLGSGGWRWPYLLSAVCLPVLWRGARQLPESRRWQAQHPAAAAQQLPSMPGRCRWAGRRWVRRSWAGRRWVGRGCRGELGPPRSTALRWRWPVVQRWVGRKGELGRLSLVCAGVFCFAAFSAPALAFQTQFLIGPRHYSAGAASVLEQAAGTVGGFGTLVAGRLADTWGRRPVGVICALGAAVFMIAAYSVPGWPMWALDTVAQVFFYGTTPVLSVYGAELFATPSRAAKAGAAAAASALGATVGLLLLPALSQRPGDFAAGLALLAIGPLVLVVLLCTRFPETAGAELEPA